MEKDIVDPFKYMLSKLPHRNKVITEAIQELLKSELSRFYKTKYGGPLAVFRHTRIIYFYMNHDTIEISFFLQFDYHIIIMGRNTDTDLSLYSFMTRYNLDTRKMEALIERLSWEFN